METDQRSLRAYHADTSEEHVKFKSSVKWSQILRNYLQIKLAMENRGDYRLYYFCKHFNIHKRLINQSLKMAEKDV